MNARGIAADVVARVTGPVVAVYQRLCLGTGQMVHGIGDLLAPAASGWGFLPRCGGCVLALWFAGRLFERAPHAVFAMPVVWLLAAWHMSDSSATPPPEATGPLGDIYADESADGARVVRSPEGVMCIVHPVRNEVSDHAAP